MSIPRGAISIGAQVEIVLKRDQRTGRRTVGRVERILTRSEQHPHGIKVRLEGGAVGRVQAVLPDDPSES